MVVVVQMSYFSQMVSHGKWPNLVNEMQLMHVSRLLVVTKSTTDLL
jgi:hypothetical protein